MGHCSLLNIYPNPFWLELLLKHFFPDPPAASFYSNLYIFFCFYSRKKLRKCGVWGDTMYVYCMNIFLVIYRNISSIEDGIDSCQGMRTQFFSQLFTWLRTCWHRILISSKNNKDFAFWLIVFSHFLLSTTTDGQQNCSIARDFLFILDKYLLNLTN